MPTQSRDPIVEIESSLQILGSLLTILIGDANAAISDRLFIAKHHINEARKQLLRQDPSGFEIQGAMDLLEINPKPH